MRSPCAKAFRNKNNNTGGILRKIHNNEKKTWNIRNRLLLALPEDLQCRDPTILGKLVQLPVLDNKLYRFVCCTKEIKQWLQKNLPGFRILTISTFHYQNRRFKRVCKVSKSILNLTCQQNNTQDQPKIKVLHGKTEARCLSWLQKSQRDMKRYC